MTQALLTMTTRPYYRQVAIFDKTVTDAYPDWTETDGKAASTPFGVAVLTRPDELGPIRIDVVVGQEPIVSDLVEVYSGHIEVSDEGGLTVGSVVGADLKQVAIAPGHHRLRAMVSPAGDQVLFWIAND